MGFKSAIKSRTTVAKQGLAIRVESVEQEGTDKVPLILKGTAVLDNKGFVEAGQNIRVIMGQQFSAGQNKQITSEMGAKAGSVVMLDGVNKGARDGEYLANWANTLVSQRKRDADKDSDHHNRTILSTVAEVPTVSMVNQNRAEGEPERITWRLNADKAKFSGRKDAPVYDRAWLASKMQNNDTVKVYYDNFFPEKSQVAGGRNAAEIMAGLENIVSELIVNNQSALIRGFSDDAVLLRKVFNNMENDPDVALKYIRENGLFPNADDSTVMEVLESGTGHLEVMPMERRHYGGDTRQRIIDGFTNEKARNKQMIGVFGMADYRHSHAEVYIPMQMMHDETGNESLLTIGSMVRGGPFRGNLQSMPTAHFDKSLIKEQSNENDEAPANDAAEPDKPAEKEKPQSDKAAAVTQAAKDPEPEVDAKEYGEDLAGAVGDIDDYDEDMEMSAPSV